MDGTHDNEASTMIGGSRLSLRGPLVSLVRDEIAEQPEVLERALAEDGGPIAAAAREIARRRPRYAVIAARGSSDNAARYAQHLLGRLLHLPVALATPSLHTLYHEPPRYLDALVIGISQSGESPDIVAVVEEAKRLGCVTVAVTNDPRSPLAAVGSHVLELHAGEERSVAATKTYTASLGVLAALAVAIAGDRARRSELQAMPEEMARQLALGADLGAAIATAAEWERVAVIGRGADYGTAFEAALKLKELTRIVAEAASPADFLHGPIAMVGQGFPVLGIAPPGPTAAGVRELLDAVRERGGETAVIGKGSGDELRLRLVSVPDWLSPLVAVIPAQLLAVGVAERLGVDVDRPFGLHKITRTT
jgi:glucosamine--fructose-6-phosphate aminotransferase (isomerizing)